MITRNRVIAVIGNGKLSAFGVKVNIDSLCYHGGRIMSRPLNSSVSDDPSSGGSQPRCAAGQVEGFSDQAVRGEPVARSSDEVLDEQPAWSASWGQFYRFLEGLDGR